MLHDRLPGHGLGSGQLGSGGRRLVREAPEQTAACRVAERGEHRTEAVVAATVDAHATAAARAWAVGDSTSRSRDPPGPGSIVIVTVVARPTCSPVSGHHENDSRWPGS